MSDVEIEKGGVPTPEFTRVMNRYFRQKKSLYKSLKVGLITQQEYYSRLNDLKIEYGKELRSLQSPVGY